MSDFYQVSDNKLIRKPTYESIKRVQGIGISKRGSNQYAKKYKVEGIVSKVSRFSEKNGLWGETYTRSPWKAYVTSFMVFTTLLMGGATYFKHEGFNQAYAAKKERVILLTPTPTPFVANFKDVRVKKVYEHLSYNHSPLATYSEHIVNMADKYDIPWTLITAIAGKESSYGKAINPGSFNAWGVMAWDKSGKRSIRQFSSWEESIEFESKLLSESYRANMNRAIQEKYCPVEECSSTWTANVTKFQEDINE